jgi:hypothetical protein
MMVFLTLPYFVSAAELYIETTPTVPRVGEELRVTLFVDPQGEAINALEGSVSFSQNLQVDRIYHGDSIINYWLKTPTQDGDAIYYAGVIPGGYVGDIGSQWQGYRPGKVFEVIFDVTDKGDSWIQVGRESVVLLHDGKATEAALVVRDTSFVVAKTSDTTLIPKGDVPWNDTEPPERFTPVVTRYPDRLFGGKYYLVFQAYDLSSGIDRYEVQEGDGLFVKADSPYLLDRQKRDLPILVRAYDQAGNVREEVVAPHATLLWYDDMAVRYTLLALVALLLGGMLIMRRKIKQHAQKQ